MASYHMHIEVRGALKWPNSRLKGMFRNKETGKHLTPDEVRELLMDHLTEGHECIPCGPCDNFNHSKDGGCMGHNAPHEGPAPDSGAGPLDAVVGPQANGGNDGNLG